MLHKTCFEHTVSAWSINMAIDMYTTLSKNDIQSQYPNFRLEAKKRTP